VSWWATARDDNASVGARALAGVGCGVFPWVCLAQEAAADAATAATRERDALVFGEAGGGEGSGVMDEIRATIGTVGDAAAAPAQAGANLLMWGSVLAGILLLMVLLGLLVWYVLIPFVKGGPRPAP